MNCPVWMEPRIPPRQSGWSLHSPKNCLKRKGGNASSVALGGDHSSTSSRFSRNPEKYAAQTPPLRPPQSRGSVDMMICCLRGRAGAVSEVGLGFSCSTSSSEGKPQTTARTLANSGLPEGKARTSNHTSLPLQTQPVEMPPKFLPGKRVALSNSQLLINPCTGKAAVGLGPHHIPPQQA